MGEVCSPRARWPDASGMCFSWHMGLQVACRVSLLQLLIRGNRDGILCIC